MRETAAWFLTGTDTDAGKTWAARAILLAARKEGIRAQGYKPIESGCPSNQVAGRDAQALATAAGTGPETSYVFEAAVAPGLAAKQTQEHISLALLQSRAQQLRQQSELLIIEGAGGLLVPLTEQETIADLAITLALPLLIVAPDCLGSVNHSLLTIEAARQRGLPIAGLILSERVRGSGQGLGNESQIREHGQVRVLRLPFCQTDQELTRAGQSILRELLADTES